MEETERVWMVSCAALLMMMMETAMRYPEKAMREYSQQMHLALQIPAVCATFPVPRQLRL